MKSRLKTLEFFSISIILILIVYLVHLNISIGSFKSVGTYSSTANYIEIEEEIDIVENIEEEIKEEIEEEIEEDNFSDIVYDGKTLDELAATLDKSLNSTISGKGYLIASHSLELGVDPYMATAIILQETGCKWECSYLVKSCNNVGGQKGQGCGSYSYFPTLDEGIIAFIDNLYKNYISYGLTTPEQINPKYAESQEWAYYVNNYIESIKAQ